MQGGYLDNDNMGGNAQSTQKVKERGGLIPINAKILKDANVNTDESVEFMNNHLSDVSVVGYLKDYQEMEARVKIKLWDQTGMIEIVFYNKNESESHSGLANFYYEGNNRLVKVFGTVKTYKKEKHLQGAKIMYVDDNELIYHNLEIVNDWLYLTGRMQALKQEGNAVYNEDARNLSKGYGQGNDGGNLNNHPIGYSHQPSAHTSVNDQIAIAMKEIAKNSGGRVNKNTLFNLLEKRFKRDMIVSTIKNLSDNGYMLEEDEYYSIFSM